MSTPAGALGDLLGTLNTVGLEDYEVAQGAPVSISQVGGVTSSSVGSAFSGISGTFIVIVIAILALAFAFRRKDRG